jgi:hypothetical protein
MRTSLLYGALFGLIQGCGTTPAIAVVHLGPGDHSRELHGDPVKIRRGAQEPYAALGGGFFVVRTTEDWRNIWAGANKEAPPLPPTLDTTHSMLVLAIGEARDVVAMQVKKIVDTGELLQIEVKETKPGEGCSPKIERPAFDAVVVDRIDKPVKFLVEDDRTEACGTAPLAEAKCRIGSAAKWEAKLDVQPGDVVECEMTAKTQGRFEISDRVIRLDALPGGSSAKLAYTKGPTRGQFTIDVFGTYKVRAEATDEAGRTGVAVVPIEAVPPKTRDVWVELVWAGFDASDDPETFPRVRLRAREPGKEGHECTSETPVAGVCEAKAQGAYTHMKVAPGAKPLALAITYTDERVEKGPYACLQVYTNGARTGETCDRKHRDPDDRWEAGTLDPATGKIADANGADAGAPDAGAPPKKK